jgi:hypothetical protein
LRGSNFIRTSDTFNQVFRHFFRTLQEKAGIVNMSVGRPLVTSRLLETFMKCMIYVKLPGNFQHYSFVLFHFKILKKCCFTNRVFYIFNWKFVFLKTFVFLIIYIHGILIHIFACNRVMKPTVTTVLKLTFVPLRQVPTLHGSHTSRSTTAVGTTANVSS